MSDRSVLADLPVNPVPRGTVSGYLTTEDGTEIRYARWRATTRKRRGSVVLLQGRAEFIEKYFETANDLRRRGFSVATFDFRGQGGSERLLSDRSKGHVDSFDQYVQDVDCVMQQVVLADCPPPYYILGHSTGAAVALLYTSRARTQVERMVLTAPLLGVRNKSRRVLLTASGIMGYLGLAESYIFGGSRTLVQTYPFENNVLTTDRDRYDRVSAIIEARPDLGLGSPTIGWLHAAMEAADYFASPEFPEIVQLPVLMVISGADPIISNRMIELMSSRMKTGAHVLIPGARHEVLSEADRYRDQFWSAFSSFVGL